MKNILKMITTLTITIFVILLMVKGLSIGNLKIYNISEIIDENSKLDSEIESILKLKNENYKDSVESLETSTKALQTAKQAYLDEASISSDSEIKEASISQNYTMEFLWNKVGSYATEEGVNLKWEVLSSGNNKYKLNFTVVGNYISIINYVYDMENDSDLNFTILNFKISGTDSLTATFCVNDILIKSENVSNAASNVSIQKDNTTSNDTNNTDTTNNNEVNTNTSTNSN